jgi:hypothetical protein
MGGFRRYLADEDRFGVLGSEPYPLRSILRPAVTMPPQAPPGRPGRRRLPILSLAALVLAAVVAVLVVTLSGGGEPVCTASATPTAAVDATPEPTPTCR